MPKGVDHVKPLKALLRRKRMERGLSREKLADALERLPDYPGGVNYEYLVWLEYYRTTIPRASEIRFWLIVKFLCIPEDELLDSISEGIRATIPSSLRT